MSNFCKMYGSLLNSSVWQENKETRLVWITMLVMKDADGFVEASVPGLADRAKVTLEECVEALKILSRPDPWSRSKAHEGRRIEEVEGGWVVLNHAKYRDFQSEAEKRAYWRKKKAESRARKLGPSVREQNYVQAMENGDVNRAERLVS